jgi:signal transduction histidine kinase
VLQHSQPRWWHPEELELVKWVSTQVSATAIQQQTLQQVQSLVEERTAQLQQSLDVQAKLYEKTRQQIDQLQQLNQLKEEFMSSMSHELRTPLTTMSLAIRMLRHSELPLDRRDKYLQILEQECNREIDLIEDLLSLQWLESDQCQISLQKIDLMLLIEKLAQTFNEKWADKRLTLRVNAPVPSLIINTEPDSLKRILLELLTNAGKYSDPDTTVHLEVAQQVQQSVNQIVLTLTNTGPGISPTDLEHIFDKFRRGRGATANAVQGTGLGLALVKCLVQHLNGTIEASSHPLDNSQTALTSFTITLPSFHLHTKI